MALDINTPRGQQSLDDEYVAARIFEMNNPAYRYYHTPKREPGDIDGVLCHALGDVKGVAETKCRYDMTIGKFHSVYSDQWLVTFDKIIKGMKIGEAMRVPFFGFLYLVQSKALLVKLIWSPEGGLNFPEMLVRKTATQATINGGVAVRDNAFLDMTGTVPMYMKSTP